MLFTNLSRKEDIPNYKEYPGVHTYGVVYLKGGWKQEVPLSNPFLTAYQTFSLRAAAVCSIRSQAVFRY